MQTQMHKECLCNIVNQYPKYFSSNHEIYGQGHKFVSCDVYIHDKLYQIADAAGIPYSL